jgi:hypothetical protein
MDQEPSTTQRILDVTPLLGRNAVLSGWASAYVNGVDALDGRDAATMAALPIDAVLRVDMGRRSSASVRYHREPLDEPEVTSVHGLPTATAERATFDGVRWSVDLESAVAFVDACLRAGIVSTQGLTTYAVTHRGWRGVGRVLDAITHGDAAARNGWESRLRAFAVVEAGLPRPEVNLPVFDREGRLLGIPDLLWPDAALVLEYDGSGHRDRRQHRDDNVREELLEGAGLTVVRAQNLDLRHHRAQLKGRIGAGYQRGLARDRRCDAWTLVAPRWWSERETGGLLSDEEKAEIFGV